MFKYKCQCDRDVWTYDHEPNKFSYSCTCGRSQTVSWEGDADEADVVFKFKDLQAIEGDCILVKEGNLFKYWNTEEYEESKKPKIKVATFQEAAQKLANSFQDFGIALGGVPRSGTSVMYNADKLMFGEDDMTIFGEKIYYNARDWSYTYCGQRIERERIRPNGEWDMKLLLLIKQKYEREKEECGNC